MKKICSHAIGIILAVSHSFAQDVAERLEPRVVKRTAMIERGREIIMEEVVFESKTEKAVRTLLAPKVVLVPSQKETQLISRSFVVNPMIRPDGLSLVTWWSLNSKADQQKHQCWSNLNWPVLGTGISFTAGEIRYSAMCLPGAMPAAAAGAPPRWLRPFPEMWPSYRLVSHPKARRYTPDPKSNRFMRDLHRHLARNHRELRNESEQRKLAAQVKKEERLAEKLHPKDLVIRFGLRPRAKANEESSIPRLKR